MLSKSQISFVKSLHQKKHRKENRLFIVEGLKSVKEFTQSNFKFHSLYYVGQTNLLHELPTNINLFEVNNAELAKISTLQTPQDCLALIYLPEAKKIDAKLLENHFTLVLDGVQDPGNLGAIIRTADWFGFKRIICANNTAEAYNPKTVQATMGSLARVEIFYADLPVLLKSTTLPIFGALLNGRSIYKTNWGKEGLIVLGNEGKGISDEVMKLINEAVTIPQVGKAESLNVAISAAIFCSEIARI